MNRQPIIFVDDDPLYLTLVKSIAGKSGVQAHYAESGEDALKIMSGTRCETMITDLNMPGMNGIRLSMLARELLPDLCIIMVTSAIEALDAASVPAAAGISRVLEKPSSAKQILNILEFALLCGS